MTDDLSLRIADIASTYGTDTIFILGKGASLDEIPAEAFAGSLVIGLNDAERVIPADITLFHDQWVVRALADNGFKSRLYIAPGKAGALRENVASATFIPMQQDTADFMLQRLLGDDIVIEEVLFLSALQVARRIAALRGRKQTVYMVGFDFGAGYSAILGRDYSGGSEAERTSKLAMQEFVFLNALYMLKDSDLDVLHVGRRPFSRIAPEILTEQFLPVRAGSNDPNRVAVVAELTTNHFGDRNRLERMVRSARAAGADFVKVQKRNVETFYTRDQLDAAYKSPFGTTFADYRHAIELTRDDFAFLDRLCGDLGIGWFASVLDEPSFLFMQQFEPAMVKLPSTISEHRDYLTAVAGAFRGTIVLSTGMTDRAYEEWVTATFSECERLLLLQCNSAYPTPAHDCNVAVVRHYARLGDRHPRIVPGYSSHDFGWMASALAVAAGARMVEKHVKLGNTDWAHFDAVAVDLTTRDFKDYVDKIREAEVMLGSEEKKVSGSEHHKYRIGAAA